MASFEDFQKMDLRIGRIKSAERVPGSDKLLKLQVDLGNDQRQLIAGIAKEYDPDVLVGKEIVVVAGLEPRKFMGIESEGMLLAANEDGKPILLMPEKQVQPGTEVT